MEFERAAHGAALCFAHAAQEKGVYVEDLPGRVGSASGALLFR